MDRFGADAAQAILVPIDEHKAAADSAARVILDRVRPARKRRQLLTLREA